MYCLVFHNAAELRIPAAKYYNVLCKAINGTAVGDAGCGSIADWVYGRSLKSPPPAPVDEISGLLLEVVFWDVLEA